MEHKTIPPLSASQTARLARLALKVLRTAEDVPATFGERRELFAVMCHLDDVATVMGDIDPQYKNLAASDLPAFVDAVFAFGFQLYASQEPDIRKRLLPVLNRNSDALLGLVAHVAKSFSSEAAAAS